MNALIPLAGSLFGLALLSSASKAAAKPTPPTPDSTTPPATLPLVPGGRGVPDQESYVVAARRGLLEFTWLDLPGAPGWQVTSDAVKLEGVRFPVSARTAQRIADIVGARLTTPVIEDLLEAGAEVKVVSPTWDHRTMNTPEAIAGFNGGVDQQLAEKGLECEGCQLVSAVGKSWVLTRDLETRKVSTGQVACNYGMFRPDGPYSSITNRYRLWQQPGYRHDIDHWDYSQLLRLCRPTREGLVVPSHDGVTITRQPGVPVEGTLK